MIDAAKAAGVAQLAYVGVFGGPKADFLLADDHRETEQLILDSGLPYTFLRNNWYSDAPMLTADLPGIVERGAIVTSVAAGSRIATAPRTRLRRGRGGRHERRRASEHGVRAGRRHRVDVRGVRRGGVAAERREGRPHLRQPGRAAGRYSPGAGIPEAFADILVDVDAAISRGLLAGTPGDLSRLIGRPTTPLADSIAAALAT